MTRQANKAEAFRALHAGEPFVIPNPWDAGSARMFEALGFQALATTSSGFAFTLGRLDSSVTLDEIVAHTAALDAATGLPISVDLENGYGAAPEDAALAITRVAEAGAVGGSIEDWDPSGHLYEPAACGRARRCGRRGRPVARLPVHADGPRGEPHPRQPGPRRHDRPAQAFDEAGADVLYAPGLRTVEDIRTVCEAVSKPVNVLALPAFSVAEVFERRRAAGQRRRRAHLGRDGRSRGGGDRDLATGRPFGRSARRVPLGEWFSR